MKAHVIKEQRATFSAAPETESPAPHSGVRSSRRRSWRAIGPAPAGPPPWKARSAAAIWRRKRVAQAAGKPAKFLVPDPV